MLILVSLVVIIGSVYVLARRSAPKDVPVVTPLMDFVRQKRAAKGGSRVSGSSSLLQNATTPAKNSHSLNPLKPNKQREGTRRIRSTHLDEDTRQKQPSTRSQLEQRIQASIQDRDRKPPRPLSAQSYQKNINGALEVKVHIEKQER